MLSINVNHDIIILYFAHGLNTCRLDYRAAAVHKTFSVLEVRVVILAGGVGAARFLQGIVKVIPAKDVSCIVNTGDGMVRHGLHISPDLDIITYTLAGIVDSNKGWGIRQDTYNCLEAFRNLGLDEWFGLGDKDLATHIYRTELLDAGVPLSEVTSILCERFGVRSTILPMTNDKFETWVRTDTGWMHFEEYYVRRACRDEVRDVEFRGAESAHPSPGLLDLVRDADLIIVAPSNPVVSIGTILAVHGIREALQRGKRPVVAVSPIVAGVPLKGPADKFMIQKGLEVSARGVARLYEDFLDLMILDHADEGMIHEIAALGIRAMATNTVMRTMKDKVRLARFVLENANQR
jgi:LPPG:FO 2-phospho-L-lactate transferase